MVLADPCLVIIQMIEVLQQLHVAIDREQRVLVERMKRREENAGLEKTVVHGCFSSIIAVVIPGRAEGASPESRNTGPQEIIGPCSWAPGCLAALGPRGDGIGEW